MVENKDPENPGNLETSRNFVSVAQVFEPSLLRVTDHSDVLRGKIAKMAGMIVAARIIEQECWLRCLTKSIVFALGFEIYLGR